MESNTTDASSDERVLGYESGLRRRVRWRRVTRVACLLIALAVVAIYHRPILTKVQTLWAQYRCMHYSDDTAVPVYAWGPRESNGSGFSTLFPGMQDVKVRGAYKIGGRVVGDWMRLSAHDPGRPGFVPEGTVFLGMLKSASGLSRLVAVDVSQDYELEDVDDRVKYADDIWLYRALTLRIAIVEPEGITNAAQFQWRVTMTDLKALLLKAVPQDASLFLGSDVLIYAGCAEADDPSQFRAKVTIGGCEAVPDEDRTCKPIVYKGTLTGRLLDDGSVEISLDGFEQLARRPDPRDSWRNTGEQ